MIIITKTTIKATGKQFRYEIKQSWNVLYYSFDNGATWHRTKSAAYKAALDTGLLQEC